MYVDMFYQKHSAFNVYNGIKFYETQNLSLSLPLSLHIYIYVSVCVCVCVQARACVPLCVLCCVFLVGWLATFYGILTLVGYWMSNKCI